MFELTNDKQLFKTFWADERNTPRWCQDGSDTWYTTEQDFLDWCKACWKVYNINDIALVYAKRLDRTASVHFSFLRGNDVKTVIPDLMEIRDELLKDVNYLFGYVGTHNRALKRIVEVLGFRYDGFKMYEGFSHNRLLEWQCFTLHKNS